MTTATMGAVVALAALTGCELTTETDPPETEDTPMTDETPAAEEALEAVGLPVPEADLTIGEGIVVSELDEWSLRVSFSADAGTVEEWLAEAFGESRGLTVPEDGMSLSQRLAPEEVTKGSRFLDGSNPEDPSASYAMLISPEGTEVLIALARTSR
ncbi:MAG: hypothetical protein L0H74_09350 [Brachybacterium sp.]|nr:hypothetical protein [Brachybacterium sp.]